MKYYLIAGEASGDLHASNLMKSIKERDKSAEFRFFGGDLMQRQGGELVKHYREMAFMGIIPVLLNAKTILHNLRVCKDDIAGFKPNVVILIDYPGFNLKIAEYVKEKLKLPVVYYISPKVWAWKEYRIKSLKKYVDVMLSILPFEVDFYNIHNFPVHYVGNPLMDAIADRPYKNETFQEFATSNNLESRPVIAVLAGSRTHEISRNLPAMLRSLKSFEGYQIIVAGAPGIQHSFYEQFQKEVPFTVLFDQTYRILSQSEAAVVTSGTATLETALLNVPQVVCYSTSFPRLSYWAFKNILHTPYISLVNLICGQEVVKELFARNFSVENIRIELHQILNVQKYRQTMLHNYGELRNRVGEAGASDRAADIILENIRYVTA